MVQRVTLNPLEEARRHYVPPMPKLLRQVRDVRIQRGQETTSQGHAKELETLFPRTFGQPKVTFVEERGALPQTPMRIGVLFSGGQAPGGHNVIVGLFEALKRIEHRCTLMGFLNGPGGLLNEQTMALNESHIDQVRNSGGFDLLGSGRVKIETPEDLKKAHEVVQKWGLDGLVIIGGDDSNTNAAVLAEYFLQQGGKTKVIGVPKTIDGDLKNEEIEASFGFDTACKTYSELIGNLGKDALSAKKYTHFVKLMGRSASHITLECALQTHPNMALIGEEEAVKGRTLHQITESLTDLLIKRYEMGKAYGLILVPEGFIEFVPQMKQLIGELNRLVEEEQERIIYRLSAESRQTWDFLPELIQKQLLLDRDPHGNVQVSHIATEELLIESIRSSLARKNASLPFSPIRHFFGYEGRAAFPSNFDASLCYSLGAAAAALLAVGLTGYMSSVQGLTKSPENWTAGGVPLTMLMHLEERKGKQKPVIAKALVDLNGKPFETFASLRDTWATEDDYRSPGGLQLFGPTTITNATTFTLQLEAESRNLRKAKR